MPYKFRRSVPPTPFARRLRRLREDAGLTQSALAEELGFDHSIVSRWENGDRVPEFASVVALSSMLNDRDESLVIGAGFLPAWMRQAIERDQLQDVVDGIHDLARATIEPHEIPFAIQELTRRWIEVMEHGEAEETIEPGTAGERPDLDDGDHSFVWERGEHQGRNSPVRASTGVAPRERIGANGSPDAVAG